MPAGIARVTAPFSRQWNAGSDSTMQASITWRTFAIIAPNAITHASMLRRTSSRSMFRKFLRRSGCSLTASTRGRRWFHHFTLYGFLLCFASTSTAAVYHYVMQWPAPYGYFSLPVVLGTAGGIGLVIGPAGLWALKRRQDPMTGSSEQTALDSPFIVLLLLTSITGLLLLVLRQSAWMGPLLIIHLAIVAALFVTLPYGKFVHGIYRSAALVRYAIERARPPASVLKESGKERP